MSKTFHATFDGKVLRPDEPLELEPNTLVKLTIETIETLEKKKHSFLQTARSLKLEGPLDWSTSLEHYLYGEKINAS